MEYCFVDWNIHWTSYKVEQFIVDYIINWLTFTWWFLLLISRNHSNRSYYWEFHPINETLFWYLQFHWLESRTIQTTCKWSFRIHCKSHSHSYQYRLYWMLSQISTVTSANSKEYPLIPTYYYSTLQYSLYSNHLLSSILIFLYSALQWKIEWRKW